jgi:hypothetical protein
MSERSTGQPLESDAAQLEALRREVAATKWRHTIDLGHGIVTPGIDP